MGEDQKRQVFDAVEASERKLIIPNNAAEEVFYLLKDLRTKLPSLSPVQIRMMRDVLRLRDPEPPRSCFLPKQRIKEEARM